MDCATASTKSSAAYGHACANCVKAKCRCVPRDGASCERCHRLSKNCQPAAFVRKRGARKPASSNRTAMLEDKLDNLVNLLQAQNSIGITASSELRPSLPTTHSQGSARTVGDALRTPIASATTSHTSPLSDDDLLRSDAEQDLFTFRTRYLEFFPFMQLSPDTTAEQLQRERPFLCKAIRVACTKFRAIQNDLGKQVREEIAVRVVANSDRSMDLLLGLLVCMIWQQYFKKTRPSLGMFLSVARTLIFDLKLDRPPIQFLGCPKLPPFNDMPEPSDANTDEEMRAVAACFAFSAVVSMSLKYDTTRWSPQLEESCNKLDQSALAGDKVLVALTRISKVAVDATDTLQRLTERSDYGPGLLLHIKALRTLLDNVRSGLTAEQLRNRTVLSYLYSTEVMIHEAALYPAAGQIHQALDPHRTEYLFACLHATKSALDNFLALNFIHISMPTILSFSHGTQVLYKLSILEHPGWDRAVVRATADVLWYLEQCAEKMAQADEAISGEGGQTSVFLKGCEAMRATVVSWGQALESAGTDSVTTGLTSDASVGLEATDVSWMNFGDDVWFPEVFARY